MGPFGAGQVDVAALFDATPTPYLVLTPDLVIVAMNRARERVTGRRREDIVGRPLFDVFPDNPDDPSADGVLNLRRSLLRVLETGEPHTMPIQKYDIRDPEGDDFVERYWSPVNVPVLDEHGRIVLLLHRVEDVTDWVLERRLRLAEHDRGEKLRRRFDEVEADLFARARELHKAWEAEADARQRLAALAEVALRISRSQTREELTAIIADHGVTAVGAAVATIAVLADGDSASLTLTQDGSRWANGATLLRLDGPLPVSVAAAANRKVLLHDETECLAFTAQMEPILADTDCRAWAALPLRLDNQVIGSITVGWKQPQSFSSADTEILEALAAQCAVALAAVHRRAAEQDAAAASRRIAETLQRSMLTAPIEPDRLRIAVRYQPASQEARVGGDWYDAFMTADESTCLVIGDVAGHDLTAAAAMGQVRNLLRGVAYTVSDPPPAVLSALDGALRALRVPVIATAVFAKIEHGSGADGVRRLQWSNAGHLPPLVCTSDGAVHILRTGPDLLLGIDPATERTSHGHALHPGDTVLLYTDGLVERRGEDIDDGIDRLAGLVGRLCTLELEALCDSILAELGGEHAEDDIALLALRVH